MHQDERAAIAEVTEAHHDPSAPIPMPKDEDVGTLLVQRVAVSLERWEQERQCGLPDLLERSVEHFPLREVPAAGKPGDPARWSHRRAGPLRQIGLDGLELSSRSCALRAPHPLLELVGLDAPLEVRGTQTQNSRLSLAVRRQHASALLRQAHGLEGLAALCELVHPNDLLVA